MPDDLALVPRTLMPAAADYMAAHGGVLRAEDVAGFLRLFGLRPDGIVELSALGLSPEDIAARRDFIGGSEIRILVDADPMEVTRLWRVKTGRESPEDLSDLYHVCLGNATEPYNAAWLEKRFSQHLRRPVFVERRGERVHHPRHAWAACTLDGWLADYHGESRVVQFKHVNGFSKIDGVVARYAPQAHWEALCAGADGTILAVTIGTSEPEYRDIELDPAYAGELMERAEAFMAAVRSDTPPYDLAPMQTAPAKAPKALRIGEQDMTGNNLWADAAARWLANKEAAGIYEQATKEIKKMVPEKVARAYGHGIEVRANKAGALSITPLASPSSKD